MPPPVRAAAAPQAPASPKPAAQVPPASPLAAMAFVGPSEPTRVPEVSRAAAPAVPPAPIAVADRDWLNARFADIAGQLERSLRESRPDAAFATLGRRFDKLEASLATVVTSVGPTSQLPVFSSAFGFGVGHARFVATSRAARWGWPLATLAVSALAHGVYDALILAHDATLPAAVVVFALWTVLVLRARRIVARLELAAARRR